MSVPTFVKMPRNESVLRQFGAYPSALNLGDGSTSLQRGVVAKGLSSFEPSTQATLLALVQMVDRKPVEFFDVGAHVGMHSTVVASVYPADQVHVTAFEPTPQTSRICRTLLAANRLPVRVERCAVSAEDGTAELFISPWDTSNSLTAGFRPATEVVEVPTVRLDTYCARRGVYPDVMKIDVETFEPFVLLGALKAIERSRPGIVCELLPYADKDASMRALQALEGMGYRMHRWRRAEGWLPCTAADVVDQVEHDGLDWLFTPEPLDGIFREAFTEWQAALSASRREATVRVPRKDSMLPPSFHPVAD
jgi:FkbM family methyltransferase